MAGWSRWVVAALVCGGAGVFAACGAERGEDGASSEVMLGESASALAKVADARSWCAATGDAGTRKSDAGTRAPDGGVRGAGASPLASPSDPALSGYRVRGASLEPAFTGLAAGEMPAFSLGRDASSAWSLEDVTSGVTARVKLRDAAPSTGALGADGVLVYPDALGSGSHVFVRAGRSSVEDFVVLPPGSTRSELVYDVTLGPKVAGLRLVANGLELLDANGTPRLRVDPPKITDASCTDRWARLSVEGCAVDVSAGLPWGRAVTPPGASTCRVRVSWTLAELELPAVVDPTWSYTAVLPGGVRGGHAAVVLADGRVMVAGNSNGGAPSDSVVIYDPRTWSWANTASMIVGRYFHQLTLLPDGSVLATGGIAPTGIPVTWSECWIPSAPGVAAPFWQASVDNGARARHAAVLVGEGTNAAVLIAGSDVSDANSPPPILNFIRPEGGGVHGSGSTNNGGSTGLSGLTLTRLPDGRVLQAGGRRYWCDPWTGACTNVVSNVVRIYTRATNTWTDLPVTSALKQARYGHAAVLVGGKVLIAGGTGENDTPLSSAELWDPATGTSKLVPPMQTARAELSLSLDNLGAPLVHGSGWSSGGAVQRFDVTAETWSNATALPNSGWFYYGRTLRMPSGETMSFGVNPSSAFSPNLVVTLGRSCPSPLPAETACMTAGTCDANGNYTPPAVKTAPFTGTWPGACQAQTDTDGDGIEDAWEAHYFGSLAQSAGGDPDNDGMTNLEEFRNALNPTVDESFEDADGDRYPNVFELRRGSDPRNVSSTPAPNLTVNAAGGGTHTTIGAAVAAANATNGAYQIIGIAAGTYKGAANLRSGVIVEATKPKLLFIGLEGASKTVIDGDSVHWGWWLKQAAVVSSLTFQKTGLALYVDAPAAEVRIVDVLVRDNAQTSASWSGATGLTVNAGLRVHVVGSTFLDNRGVAAAEQIWAGGVTTTLTNTVVWGSAPGTQLGKAPNTTLVTNGCLVKGQTLAGTGNLPGATNPKLRSDGRLLWDSPLREAGRTVTQSRRDLDLETRPATMPDIGVDQYVDSDGDGLADRWERDQVGNLTTLTSRTQDADGDGLTNEQEYARLTKPTVADTDGDGLSDGVEVNTHGTNPVVADTDGDDMPDGWEVTNGLSPLAANAFEDADGDRYPNVFEYARGTRANDAGSVPTPNFTVNAAGGGTHTTVGAAIAAANVTNGAYQIVGIAAGTYTGDQNLRGGVTVAATKPKLLLIGLAGASKTIIDGERARWGWALYSAAVVASVTIQNTWLALGVDAPGQEVRVVDVLVRDNVTTDPEWATGVHVKNAARVHIVGSTFLDNWGKGLVEQVWAAKGTMTLTNTVIWGRSSGAPLGKAADATLVTNHCLVKGQTLVGTGNLPGDRDPKLRSDARLRSDSPLRRAGGTTASSRLDFDGEARPSVAPDIGVDQFRDAEIDGLPDAWEVATVGNTTGMTGTADQDADGLTNLQEYDAETNPLVANFDATGDRNGDGVLDGLGRQLGFSATSLDSDGDGVSNADELRRGLDPLRRDTDGDGVPDGTDPYPLDPRIKALPASTADVTPPVITLTTPWNAEAR